MPREQINYPDLRRKTLLRAEHKRREEAGETPIGEPMPNDAAVHVGWSKEQGWCQVGLEVDLEYLVMAAETPNGARSDRTLLWSPTLGIAEVSFFIQQLQKARDAMVKALDVPPMPMGLAPNG